MKRNLIFTLVALGLLTSGCTEELPFDKKVKFDVMAKSNVDTESLHLYVPVVGDSLRTSDASRPHWVGMEKLVKFKFSENSLDLVEVEKDERFADNSTNQKPVLSIPVNHVDFRCAEDVYGDCQNKEEENEDKHWSQRKYFVPDLDQIAVDEVNFLPISLRNLFGGCYTSGANEPLSFDLGSHGLVVEVQVNQKTQGQCAGFIMDLEDLSSLSFKVKYTYNILKLNQVASEKCDPKVPVSKQNSSCYSVVEYPRERDDGVFGFFNTERRKLGVDNQDTQDGVVQLLNRFNPKKKVIPYYLSDSLLKPQNVSIKEATYEGIARVNLALREAGTDLQLEIKEQAGLNPGDIRNNMIIMVEDPVAAGLLGYGPSIPNPLTGEIIHARTVMYLGTMKKLVRRTYEALRVEREAQALTIPQNLNMVGKDHVKAFAALLGGKESLSRKIASIAKGRPSPVVNTDEIKSSGKTAMKSDLRRSFAHLSKEDLASFYNLDPAKLPADFQIKMNNRIAALSEANAFSIEVFPAESTIGHAIKDIYAPDEVLIPWDAMDDAKKEETLSKLLPYVWIPVFVHEIGHNLGLRHNFAGSEDKSNYYTKEELAEMGINYNIPYSSVMDYSYSSLNELPKMGKYDVAALKFGYARKIALADGEDFPLNQKITDDSGKEYEVELTLAELPAVLEFKEFDYCTDDHVSANPNCNRFDEGTNLTEIATHMAKSYEEFYKWRNLRNGNRIFSLLHDPSYAFRTDDTMYSMRLFYENRERLKETFGLDDDFFKNPPADVDPETAEFLKDVDQAAVVAGEFFLKVMKTPDVMCLLVDSARPTQIIGVAPIRDLSSSAINCQGLSVGLRSGGRALAVAQGGKFFQSVRAPGNPDANASEIDVRGVWMDKILASQYLFARDLDSILFDRFTTAMISHPDLIDNAISTVADILIDDLVERVEFKTPGGQTLNVNLSYELGIDQSHIVRKPILGITRRIFELPDQETLFSRELLKILEKELPSLIDTKGNSVLEAFAVRTWINNGENPNDFDVAQLGIGRKFYAGPSNLVAKAAIQGIKANQILSQLSDEKVIEILTIKQEGKELPADAGETEKKAFGLEASVIEAYLEGSIRPTNYYERLLTQLIDANKLSL